MKIKDLKSKKVVSEIQLSSFGLGDYGSALGKQLVGKGGGLTKQDLMTQNIYIKNFVSNALSNLNNAIKGGLVDPKKTDKPAQTVPGASNPNINVTVGGKPVSAAPANLYKPTAAQAKPASAAPQAPVGMKYSTTFSPNATKAQTGTPAQTAPAAAQPKQTVAQKAAAYKQQQAKIKAAGIKNQPKKPVTPNIRESSYDRLNALFEHILEAASPEQTDAQSVKDYLKTVWYPNYLKGVNWKPNEQQIDKLLQQVQDTYAKDNGRAALNQLASLSYSITPRSQSKSNKTSADKNQADKKRAAATAASATAVPAPAVAAADDDDAIVATWGGVQYRKTMRGWKDKKGKYADANTAKILDQAIAQDTGETPPTKPKGPTAPAAGPAAGAAQQADNSNVIPFKKTA
jgi:hypothetical protein